jgi:hypothetical protein
MLKEEKTHRTKDSHKLSHVLDSSLIQSSAATGLVRLVTF